MAQNLVDPTTWKEMKLKSQNIDKLLEWALEKQNIRICHKHSNISNTVKHLKNLMIQFSKKADTLQKNLVKAMRIEQIQFQSQYYQKRINECLAMSQTIRQQIEEKNNILQHKEAEANKYKKKLMKLKTDNIRLSMKIQHIQQYLYCVQQKQMAEIEKQRRKMKKEEDRKMLTCQSFKRKYSLKQESRKAEVELFNKIDKAKQLRLFIEECFTELKQKLKKQQRKSNTYGLAGSMLFKLQASQDPLLPKLKKPNQSKLLIYDTLKQKYKRHIKNQNKKTDNLKISEQEFLKFSPLQIMGIIQLKGGLKQIINKKLVNQNQQQEEKTEMLKEKQKETVKAKYRKNEQNKENYVKL